MDFSLVPDLCFKTVRAAAGFDEKRAAEAPEVTEWLKGEKDGQPQDRNT
jgi:hypothetical protein